MANEIIIPTDSIYPDKCHSKPAGFRCEITLWQFQHPYNQGSKKELGTVRAFVRFERVRGGSASGCATPEFHADPRWVPVVQIAGVSYQLHYRKYEGQTDDAYRLHREVNLRSDVDVCACCPRCGRGQSLQEWSDGTDS